MPSSLSPADQGFDGGVTFLRPLPGSGSAPAGDVSGQSKLVFNDGLSASQLLHRLFPDPNNVEAVALSPVTGLELGHFVIEERIGRGGMGAVFRALDRGLDRVVALKVLSPEQSSDISSIQRFHNEARAAAQLDHNNIARVHYIGRDRGTHFIAFEFVVGTNVRDLIVQRGRLSPLDAVNYTLQIVDALRHMTAADVVHRDIKPSNIIITPTGRAKLVDLGLARHTQGKGDELTVAGTALGTFDYIAPEQAIDARNVDVRSDIYSLGCTLYHMLTGEPPYPRGSMFEKVMNHHRAAPPDPSAKVSEVPPELGRIVQKMMASRPDDRYATPDLVSQELSQVALQLGLRPQQVDSPVWSPAPYFKRPRFEGILTWMTVALVLLGATLLVDRIPWTTPAPVMTAANHPGDSIPSVTPVDASGSVSARPANGGSREVTEPRTIAPTEIPQGTSTQKTQVVAPPMPASVQASNLQPPVTTASDSWKQGFELGLAESISKLGNGFSQLQAAVMTPGREIGPEPVRPGSGLPSFDLNNSPLALNVTPPSSPLDPRSSSPASANAGSPLSLATPFYLINPAGASGDAGSAPETGYATLAEACNRANDGAIIELRYDGRLARPQSPLRIIGKRLTIRPAAGFRPVLHFALDSGVMPPGPKAAMISVLGGSLDVYSVDLEMRVDARSVVDDWTLVSCAGARELELVGVSMTVVNPDRLPAAFIELPLREGAELAETMPEKMFREPFVLRIVNSIARGQGDLIVQRHDDPVRLELSDVAAAISGSAINLEGEEVFSMSMRETEVMVDARLRHVSLIAYGGLLTADSGDHGRFLPVEIDVRDSVISIQAPGQPLIHFLGHDEFSELRDRLTWTSFRDRNFFELTGPIWRIQSTLSQFPDEPDFTFDEWNESLPQPTSDRQVQTGLFRNPRLPTIEALHRTDRSDFVLRSGEIVPNPALSSSSDRRDAGVDWTQNQLPRQFPELLPTER